MIFAQASQLPDPNSPAAIGWVVIIITGLVVGANGVLKLTDRFKSKPPTSELRAEANEKFASWTAFEKFVDEYRKDMTTLDRRIDGLDRTLKKHTEDKVENLRAERREDMQALHHEINEVGKKVASLDTETKNQNSWLSRMDNKLDTMAKDMGTQKNHS